MLGQTVLIVCHAFFLPNACLTGVFCFCNVFLAFPVLLFFGWLAGCGNHVDTKGGGEEGPPRLNERGGGGAISLERLREEKYLLRELL